MPKKTWSKDSFAGGSTEPLYTADATRQTQTPLHYNITLLFPHQQSPWNETGVNMSIDIHGLLFVTETSAEVATQLAQVQTRGASELPSQGLLQ